MKAESPVRKVTRLKGGTAVIWAVRKERSGRSVFRRR